jgi:RHS repeat-associated protein
MSLSIDQGTNRITTAGYSYDAVGNLTADPQHTYQYDAENRLIKIDNGSTAQYWYDGYGERVKKLVGATATLYVLDVGEYSASTWQKLYVLAAGARVEYNGNGTMYWYHMDRLRTARKVTDINGSTIATKEYWPFGEEITATANNEKKYTGLYRDAEGGFDYAVSRYYSSSTGRFMSSDKFNIGAIQLPLDRPRGFLQLTTQDLLRAAQFNLFAYVLNNPINRIDPFGYCGCYPCTPPFHYYLYEDDGSGYDCCPPPDGGGEFLHHGSRILSCGYVLQNSSVTSCFYFPICEPGVGPGCPDCPGIQQVSRLLMPPPFTCLSWLWIRWLYEPDAGCSVVGLEPRSSNPCPP